jgi:hypothetical protein
LPARVYSDGINNYSAFIGRRYNGNATAPTQVLSGQTISRYGGTPYGNAGWPTISTARVDFVALEDQTATNQGTSIQFFTTPVGTASSTPSMTVASTGITNAANIVPVTDQGYSLGTSTLRWKNVYAGQGGLWLADSVTNVETQLSVSSGTFYINGVQNIALGNLVIANTTLETATSNTNIFIGNVADTGYFSIDRTTQINTQNLGNSAALLINGTLSNVVPTEYTNTLFHTVAVPGYNGIHLSDSFGNGVFSTYEGRAARGNITNPSATQSGDVLLRIAGAGYGTDTFDTALGTQGGSRMDFRATENYTNTAKGSDIHFWTTQPGTTSTVNSGSIDWQGFSGNSFKFTTDNTVQTTAGIPLTQKANALGVATLDNNGYLTAAQIPPSLTGALVYKGSWDASTNTPTLADGSGTAGWEYSIGVTGTQNLGGGSQTYVQGGFVIYNGTVWSYVPPSGLFTSLTANTHLSVNQPTGAITISVDATPSLVNSAIVSRDANGSFAANIITATLSGAATSAGTAGTVTSAVQSAITQVGTLSALTVSGNASAGNIQTGGAISATGNATANNVIATTIVNAASHTGTLVSVTGAVTAASVVGGIMTGSSLSVTGNVTANNGMFTTIVNTASFTGSTVSVTGNVTANNGQFTTIVNTASHTGSVVSVSGNITGANVITGSGATLINANVSTTGNVTGNYVVGNGSALTTITGANVTGTVANATSSLRLNVASSILAGNLTAAINVGKNSQTTLTYTITGLTTSHKIVVTPATPMPDSGTFFQAAWASAANTVSLQFVASGAVNSTFYLGYFAFV